MAGRRLDRARQQVGRIGFDHQPIRRNVFHEFAQMQAAAFVADPAGDADIQIAVEIIEQFLALAGETMHHRRADLVPHGIDAAEKIRVRIALMQE